MSPLRVKVFPSVPNWLTFSVTASAQAVDRVGRLGRWCNGGTAEGVAWGFPRGLSQSQVQVRILPGPLNCRYIPHCTQNGLGRDFERYRLP